MADEEELSRLEELAMQVSESEGSSEEEDEDDDESFKAKDDEQEESSEAKGEYQKAMVETILSSKVEENISCQGSNFAEIIYDIENAAHTSTIILEEVDEDDMSQDEMSQDGFDELEQLEQLKQLEEMGQNNKTSEQAGALQLSIDEMVEIEHIDLKPGQVISFIGLASESDIDLVESNQEHAMEDVDQPEENEEEEEDDDRGMESDSSSSDEELPNTFENCSDLCDNYLVSYHWFLHFQLT